MKLPLFLQCLPVLFLLFILNTLSAQDKTPLLTTGPSLMPDETIWFDLQQPRSSTFYVAGVDVNTLEEKKYSLTRNEWSIHYTISPDQKLFCGDGNNPTQVAKAPDGQWICLFTPEGDHFKSEKLVNMKNHNYKLEPNVHFSPDGKWVIFRANFEGVENIYAVEIKKTT